jgi:hypothetical protein
MVDPVGPNFVVGTFFFFLDGIDGVLSVLSVLGVEEVVDDDADIDSEGDTTDEGTVSELESEFDTGAGSNNAGGSLARSTLPRPYCSTARVSTLIAWGNKSVQGVRKGVARRSALDSAVTVGEY